MTVDLNNLTDDQMSQLDELVHDVASQIASDVVNEGKQLTYLLTNGWTDEEICNALGDPIPDPDEVCSSCGRDRDSHVGPGWNTTCDDEPLGAGADPYNRTKEDWAGHSE